MKTQAVHMPTRDPDIPADPWRAPQGYCNCGLPMDQPTWHKYPEVADEVRDETARRTGERGVD